MQRRYASRPSDAGFTLIELLVVVGIIAVLGAMTIPGLLRAKINANEAAVIGSMRAVNTAQAAYAGAAATGGYATSFPVLVLPCPGSNQGFISPDLAGDPSQKSGYNVRLTAGSLGAGPQDCNGTASGLGYYLTAVPITVAMTGHRGFGSSSPGVIYFTYTGVAPTEAEMRPTGGGTPLK